MHQQGVIQDFEVEGGNKKKMLLKKDLNTLLVCKIASYGPHLVPECKF